MNWLLDTDVICQPAKRRGDPRIVEWLGQEKESCYTSAIVGMIGISADPA